MASPRRKQYHHVRVVRVVRLNVLNASQAQAQKVYSQHKVRNSQADRTLESMFPVAHPSTQVQDQSDNEDETDCEMVREFEENRASTRIKDIPQSECYLTSVVKLREEVEAVQHKRKSAFSERPLSESKQGCPRSSISTSSSG